LHNNYFCANIKVQKEKSMLHSNIVGGSTAKRVINCPGSVALVQKMPPKPSSEHADRGTLLHNTMEEILTSGEAPESYIGARYKDQILTQELIDEKITPALEALDAIDPAQTMEYEVETRVGFGDLLPGVFGSTDLIGRIDDRAIVLDWKFGDGVMVEVEENPQLMFYAAAAMRTKEAQWAFDGATEIEMVIVQPPEVRRWVTTPARIAKFEKELVVAVKTALKADAPIAVGDHCRWCAAKPICPKMTGAVERALKVQIEALPAQQISTYLKNADMLEAWIKDLRALALQMLESGAKLPEYKLVAKRAIRSWSDEEKAKVALFAYGLTESEVMETTVVSPAKAEKALKKRKIGLPEDLVVAISSGNTLASADDPRPEVMLLGKQLSAALSKLQ
jgi:hypothetical protein